MVELPGNDEDLARISRERLLCALRRRDAGDPRPLRAAPPPIPRAASAGARRRSHRRGDRVPRADLERALQAQDLQRDRHLPRAGDGPTRRSARSSRRYIRGATEKPWTARSASARASTGWSRSSTTTPAWSRSTTGCSLVYKVETHNSPSALDPVRRRDHRHRRRQPRPVRHRAGRGAPRERLGLLLRVAVPRRPAARRAPPPAPHPRRRAPAASSTAATRAAFPTAAAARSSTRAISGKPLVFCGTVGRAARDASPGGRATRRRRARATSS